MRCCDNHNGRQSRRAHLSRQLNHMEQAAAESHPPEEGAPQTTPEVEEPITTVVNPTSRSRGRASRKAAKVRDFCWFCKVGGLYLCVSV